MTKGPGQENDLSKRAKKIKYKNIYDKHKYGSNGYGQYNYKQRNTVTLQKVNVVSTGTGKMYGSRAIMQRNIEGSLLKGALAVLTDGTIPHQKIKITRLAETTLEDPTMVNDPTAGGDYATADKWEDTNPPTMPTEPAGPAPSTAATDLTRALRILKSVKKTLNNLRKKAAQENDEVLVLSYEHELDMVDAAVKAIKTASQSIDTTTSSSEPIDTVPNDTASSDTAPTFDIGHIPHIASYAIDGKPIFEYSPAIYAFQRQKRLNILKQKLEAGQTVTVIDATYARSPKVHDDFTWGELEMLGYAERVAVTNRGADVTEAWKYTGPPGSTINVVTKSAKVTPTDTEQGTISKVLRSGETMVPVNVNYS